jgi:tripartite-type tricarboxylate transporter receptor subunit TctC
MTTWPVLRFSAALAIALIAPFGLLLATNYPTQPIKLIVPTSPGGAVDYMARLISGKWASAWGAAVVVENKPGAGGNIGVRALAHSAPDGHSILVYTPNVFVNAYLYKDLGYDPNEDLAPITQMVTAPYILMVNPSVPAHSVRDLIDLMRAQPGKLSWFSAPVGAPDYLSGELMRQMTNFDAVHVSYAGQAEGLIDLLAGRVEFGFVSVPNGLSHLKSGELRALGVTSATRSRLLPDVPTIAEAALPGYETVTWIGLWAPSGTPQDIVDKINSETKAALAEKDVLLRLDGLGFDTIASSPLEFRKLIQTEDEMYRKLIASSGMQKM